MNRQLGNTKTDYDKKSASTVLKHDGVGEA